MRTTSFLYIGLLIILPILAITLEATKSGWTVFWENVFSPHAVYALKITFLTALLMVVLNTITGTATAWVLVRYDFPLKGLMNALIDLPFAIPTLVTGIMIVALYGPTSAIGGALSRYGIEIIYAKPGIILALLYVTFPFVVRTVEPVLAEMDPDMEEAAKTLGAGTRVTFLRIILPTLLPAILTGAALSFSRAIGEFGSVAIVSGNIPMKTQVAAVYVYGELESYNPQGALGVSVVLLFSSFLTLVLLNRLQSWSRKHEENA